MIERTRDGTAHIVAAFDALKTIFSSDEAAGYVISLCFLRWLTELKHHADSGETLSIPFNGKIGEVKLVLPDELEYSMLMVSIDADHLGEKLDQAFAHLEHLNEELRGVFQAFDFSNRRFGKHNERYGVLRDAMISIANASSRDDNVLENLVALGIRVASESAVAGLYAPEFNTPLSICDVIARIVSPVQGESIYDPVCGSGQLLVTCAKHTGATTPPFVAANEINYIAWALAKMNLISHGISSRNLLRESALDEVGVHILNKEQATFDVVIGHPPWSARYRDHERLRDDKFRRFALGLPPKNNADYAFILHMVSSMKPYKGRMAVVISNGALARVGVEREIRKTLIERNLIDAVIGLPEKMFQGTPIPGAILVLRADRKSSELLFLDARSLSNVGRGRSILPADAIDEISRVYQSRLSIDGVSVSISRSAVVQNDFSLSLPLYINPVKENKTRPLDAIHEERIATEHVINELCGRIDRLLEDLM